MKATLTCILVLFGIFFSFGQDDTFLQSRNGFRNIRLGTSVVTYAEFMPKEESNQELFKLSMNSKTTHVYKGSMNDRIGSAAILFIYLVTEENVITEIRVVTQKVLSVYSILKDAYGEPAYNHGGRLLWRSGKIECSIEGEGSQVPGYHIRYKSISQDQAILNERMLKARKEAQGQL